MSVKNELRRWSPLKGSKVFCAQLDELSSMMKWVREILGITILNSKRRRKFEIAIEEALTNIIHYAYVNIPGMIEIQYHQDSFNGRLYFSISDQGSPFDPVKQNEKPQVAANVDQQVIGGIGIHLMKELTDSIEYKRVGNSNVLILSQVI